MTSFSVFRQSTSYGGLYAMLLVNRLQIVYFVLIFPSYLVQPSMIWAILAAGAVSQFNLFLLSKWFSSEWPGKGRSGFAKLLGNTTPILVVIGLIMLIVKIIVITLGYTDVIQQFIFPTMGRTLLILLPVALACYMAMHGMESLVRFVIIIFLCTAWIFFLFIYYWFSVHSSIRELYPLIPIDWSTDNWRSILLLVSSLSGPEYLVCLAPWLNPGRQMLKFMSIGNAMSLIEYSISFVTAIMFYGSRYLSTIRFPVIDMTRYLQSPVFQRIDMIVVPIHMINFIYALSLFMLLIFGGVRFVLGRMSRPSGRAAFLSCCAFVAAAILCVDKWFWESKTRPNIFQNLQIWLGAISFTAVPLLILFIMLRRKGRD